MRIKLILKVYVYIQTVQKIKHYGPFLWTGLTGLTGLTFFCNYWAADYIYSYLNQVPKQTTKP